VRCAVLAIAVIFIFVDAAKALAQFEHSSEVVVQIADASQEATGQFEQATEADEAFIVRCFLLILVFWFPAFGLAGATALPSNMDDVGLHQMVCLVAGGSYEPSYDILPQSLRLA
jgi:hypothetical protein